MLIYVVREPLDSKTPHTTAALLLQVTDMGLAVAAMRLPKLQLLYLSYCRNIGDAGLDHVGAMGQLQELDLYNTPCVSAAAVARIAR